MTNEELIKTLRTASESVNENIALAMLLVIAAERIEELDGLSNGDLVSLPKNREHAEAMFKVSSNYLGFWKPGEEFKFKEAE